MDIVRHPGEDLFFEAILSLRTVEDCRLFFEDVATISRVNRCLLYGGGYRTALDRLKESGVLPEGEEK